MNSITLSGNLTKDVELRYTNGQGTPVASIAIAETSRRRTSDGRFEDGPTSFFSGTVWGPMAENAAASLKRGDRVVITGRVVEREFELTSGPRAGEKVRRHEIVVEEIGPSLRFATAKPEKVRRSAQPVDDEPPL